MLIQKIKTYRWQALASLLMTGLMVASSLLQPRYLQEVLGALLTGKYEVIYSIGAWLIGVAVVGLVAGGLNVVLASYIAQGVSPTFGRIPSVKFKLFLMLILNNLMREI
ncbi:ABC transporter ATP-binding protein/permease [Streptococcus pneumoniae]|nr:ABC transporter ATP-binding protein/permease [Streptococcus pneumoniae]